MLSFTKQKQVQRTNRWLPEGRGWGRREIDEEINRYKLSVIK